MNHLAFLILFAAMQESPDVAKTRADALKRGVPCLLVLNSDNGAH